MLKSFAAHLSLPSLKSLGLSASIVCFGSMMTAANAAPTKTDADSKVEFKSSLPVTQQEIAAVEVLGEICPKIIGKNTNFDAGFKRLLTDLLPTIDQPVMALKALQDDTEYQKIVSEARIDANKATVQENRDVCLEIVNYPQPGKTTAKSTKK